MPTFNQLVRKGRKTSVKKSTAPALLGFAPQKGMLGYYKMPACLCQDLFSRIRD